MPTMLLLRWSFLALKLPNQPIRTPVESVWLKNMFWWVLKSARQIKDHLSSSRAWSWQLLLLRPHAKRPLKDCMMITTCWRKDAQSAWQMKDACAVQEKMKLLIALLLYFQVVYMVHQTKVNLHLWSIDGKPGDHVIAGVGTLVADCLCSPTRTRIQVLQRAINLTMIVFNFLLRYSFIVLHEGVLLYNYKYNWYVPLHRPWWWAQK